MEHCFREGDLVLLIDRKDRRYLLTLESSMVFHSHGGSLPHGEIIGIQHGARLSTSHGQTFLAVPPTLSDYVVHLPRVSQVIYPKDLGAILLQADIFPGARVLEAGLGSGALTITLLRAVGANGAVFSYEIREEIVGQAVRNIQSVLPNQDNLTIRTDDVYLGIQEENLDRIILDVPEPWQVLEAASEAMIPGGVFLAFLPTVLQVHQLSMGLQGHPAFDLVEAVEVLMRPWHMAPSSARPVHRMVAHTGFLVTARKCAPRKT